jgi:hypothetical protein
LEKLFLDLTEEIQRSPAGLSENWSQILGQIKEQKLLQATKEPVEKTHPMEDSLYIHNAGLVIMAPFFNRYFNMLGMLEGQAFKDEETAIRGVLLLEYLASGRTEVAEHELVFNKVLCGLPISTPVPGKIELTDHEVEISSQMQNAVLQNWEKMSTSTVENLQGSFILRNGLLLEQEEHWSLQVESAGFDVLLNFLPWTISIVSLPWVDKRLEVDWKTNI